MLKRRLMRPMIVLLLFLTCAAGASEAADASVSVNAAIRTDFGDVTVSASPIGDELYLFLPSCADLSRLSLAVEGLDGQPMRWQSGGEPSRTAPYRPGESMDWTAVADELETGVLGATLVREKDGEPILRLCVMKSENIRSLYLTSDDPVNRGRAWLEDCSKHQNETRASMMLVSNEGKVDHADGISKLRGRGNFTWTYLYKKKPYQFKLESKADLLKTGDRSERNRTWVLLAEANAPTLLHNRIALDLGLELGMEQTSRSEHVDLYYDGEYRGTYLLCEKIEVNEGRVDITDYDKIIEARNEVAGNELDAMQPVGAVNRYGKNYQYFNEVVSGDNVAEGGYLLEMESANTLSDPCWFEMNSGKMLACKNPEYANNEMMTYVMDVIEAAWSTAMNHGVNPDTGFGLDSYIDVDGFARLALINELARNSDGFSYSSTFFILPANETRIRIGPIWDCDLAYFTLIPKGAQDRPWYRGYTGLKGNSGWLPALYSCEAFREAMQRIYQNELYPIITDILLGNGHGNYLRSLDEYASEIEASCRMNYKRWAYMFPTEWTYTFDFDENMQMLRRFITERNEWLYNYILNWQPIDLDTVSLKLDAIYTNIEATVCLMNDLDYGNGVVRSCEVSQLTEATEDAYATWRCTAVIGPIKAEPFGENVKVTVNGTELPYQRQKNGTLKLTFLFDDLTYRPVYYEGEDVGLVFDYDTYVANYPEVAELCGDDREAALAYFCDEGMYEGQVGNAYCDPQRILDSNPELIDVLGEDWYYYYSEFMYNTDRTIWMENARMYFEPPVRAE